MILYICTGQEVKCIFEIYLPVREHTWWSGSGGTGACFFKIIIKRYSQLQIGWHSISRFFLQNFQRTGILPMGFTISTKWCIQMMHKSRNSGSLKILMGFGIVFLKLFYFKIILPPGFSWDLGFFLVPNDASQGCYLHSSSVPSVEPSYWSFWLATVQ